MPTKYEELQKRFGLLPSRKPSPLSTPPLNLPPSLALLAPTFPAFTALAATSELPQAEPKRGGLFSELLRDPKVLLQDLLANPEKYEDGVASLVQELVASNRSLNDLSPAETELLDRATLDFSQPTRRREVTPAPVQAQKTAAPSVEYNTPQTAPSLDGLEPYWWLK
jgi:hypothetical protein